MPVNNNYKFSAPSLLQPLVAVFPPPIVAKRNPGTADINYPIGQVWINTTNNLDFILTSVSSGSAQWNGGSGVGTFSSLTVTPGPTALTGQFTVTAGTNAVSIGADAADHTVAIGSATGSSAMTLQSGTGGATLSAVGAGTIVIGGATQTGAITLGQSTAGETVNINNASGAANTVNIGNGISGNTISIGNGANSSAQTINIANGASAANSTVSVLNTASSAGAKTFNLMNSTDFAAGAINIGNGATPNVVTLGSTNGAAQTIVQGGTVGINVVGSAGCPILIGAAAQTATITLGSSTAANSVLIQNGVNTGAQITSINNGACAANSTVNILNTASSAGAKTFNLMNSADFAAGTINIGTGAAANVVTIGSLTGAAQLLLQSGSAGISLASGATTPGTIAMTPATSSTASATNTVTMNNRFGRAKFTGFTTAAAGSQAFVITNNTVATTSAILCTVANVHNANDAQMTLQSVVIAAAGGSITVNTKNNGAGALDGDVNITFWVLS